MFLWCRGIFRFQGGPNVQFHHVHASEENDGCNKGEGVLVEDWVLEVVVVKLLPICQYLNLAGGQQDSQ